MRLSFFPYTQDIAVLANHQAVMKEHTLHSIITFKEDLAQIESFQDKTHTLCTDCIEVGLQGADGLVLLFKTIDIQWEKYYDCIDYAVQHSILIFGSQELIESIPEKRYQDLIQPIRSNFDTDQEIFSPMLLSVNTPVIAIAGLGQNCGKFECALELKEYVDSLGYQCVALSGNSLAQYSGMELLPEFLFDDEVAYPTKILRFNRWIYALCKEKNPDLLLLEIPGGIMPLSAKDTNFFAEIPLVISNAVDIDMGILAAYYINAPLDFLDNIAQFCRQKFNLSIKAFYVARQIANLEPETEYMQYFFLSDEYIANHSDQLGERTNAATPLNNHLPVYQDLISILQENLETV